MSDINIVVLMGRLTADPELRTTASGNELTRFRIAVGKQPSKNKNAKNADFINIVAWNHTARFICNYFSKGQMIAINGRLETNKYQDQDGNNREAYEIVVNEVHFCGSKPEKKQTVTEGEIQGYSNASVSDFDEITDDEDLPF